MSISKIEWTDRSWNPVRGCSIVSEGCRYCYAMKQAHRFSGPGRAYEGLTKKTNSGVKWNGKITLVPKLLNEPLKWKKPVMVFVNSMGDLFHEDVPFSFIDEVFVTMAVCPEHTFQVLTKRPKRALEYFSLRKDTMNRWLLSNVWIGVSVEDQKTANERIPHLLRIPAAVRFLSCEPLLGKVDLQKLVVDKFTDGRLIVLNSLYRKGPTNIPFIDWVIVGGESGPGARPMHPDWARSLRDQCQEHSIPFFFKQWGEYRPFEYTAQPPFVRDCATRAEYDAHFLNCIDPYTGEPGKNWGYRWSDMQLDDEGMPMDGLYLKMGKSKSGHLLDNKEHLEFPKTPNQ